MKSDFEIIAKKFDADQDIKIYPIADVHLGAAEHMEKEWSKFCANVLSDDNAYLILGGDLINNATRSAVSNVFEDTIRPRDQKKIMVEMLTPIRQKILCAVSGNHERRSGKDADDDPTYDIMAKLDLEDLYRQNTAFLKLELGKQNDRRNLDSKRRPTYMFCVTHGSGGGIYTGAAVNRNERFGNIIDGIDALVVGHSHKPFVTQPSKLFVDTRNNKVTQKPFKVISVTSWLDYGGYAAQKMLLPSSHVPQIVLLSAYKKEIKVIM